MEETKQPLVFALGRGYNGFYCPETRFHLVGVMRPQAVYAASHLSEDVKRGLRGGTIIDVNGTLTKEDVKPSKGFVYGTSSSDRKKMITVQGEEIIKKEQAADLIAGVEKDDYTAPDFSGKSGLILSESDIQTNTRKELVKFIDESEELDLEKLSLNSRSTLDEVKDALMKHFGYGEAPVNVSTIKSEKE